MESLWSWIELQISTEAVDSETLEMDLNTKLKMNLNAKGETNNSEIEKRAGSVEAVLRQLSLDQLTVRLLACRKRILAGPLVATIRALH